MRDAIRKERLDGVGLVLVFVFTWLKYCGLWQQIRLTDLEPVIAIGAVFVAEFMCLFMALDLAAFGRVLVILNPAAGCGCTLLAAE